MMLKSNGLFLTKLCLVNVNITKNIFSRKILSKILQKPGIVNTKLVVRHTIKSTIKGLIRK